MYIAPCPAMSNSTLQKFLECYRYHKCLYIFIFLSSSTCKVQLATCFGQCFFYNSPNEGVNLNLWPHPSCFFVCKSLGFFPASWGIFQDLAGKQNFTHVYSGNAEHIILPETEMNGWKYLFFVFFVANIFPASWMPLKFYYIIIDLYIFVMTASDLSY